MKSSKQWYQVIKHFIITNPTFKLEAKGHGDDTEIKIIK